MWLRGTLDFVAEGTSGWKMSTSGDSLERAAFYGGAEGKGAFVTVSMCVGIAKDGFALTSRMYGAPCEYII